jgi:predicted O-linked N-acetylglucosamine transferase (SPINDLY family)
MAIFQKISSLLQRNKQAPALNPPESTQFASAKFLVEEGNELEDAGRLDEALAKYDQAASIAPSYASAHLNRGNIFGLVGQPAFAAQAYQQAIALQPEFAAAHFNLGNSLVELKNFLGALDAYECATRYKPEFVDAWIAKGNVFGDIGQHDAALSSYQRALSLSPVHAQVHRNLGLTLRQIGRLNDARTSFEMTVKLQPDSIDGYCDLGNVARELGDVAAAVRIARLACEVDPRSAGAHSLLLFCLSHDGNTSANDLYLEHRRFGEKFEGIRDYSCIVHKNTKEPNRRIKLGVVSADLRNHAVASFFEPVFYLLQHSESLSLYIYDNGGPVDEVATRMRAHASHWSEVAKLTDHALAELIRTDGIDVLIDLSGHTPGHRLLSFVEKPAPVQLSWMGYPGTTGLRSMDYYVADPHFLPPGEFDGLFSEKIIRLPANAPFQSIDNPPDINTLPAVTNGYMTFGSFNRLDKISKDVVLLWSQLLSAVPDSRMVVGGMPLGGDLSEIKEWFSQGGVEPSRLTFHRRSGMFEYLKLHQQVDVCLDTFPYGGGTTTCHALSMGVPTLTLAGSTPAAVSSRSILSHAGIKNLFVAADQQEFLNKGQWCTLHVDEISALRSELRSRFQRSNMMQPKVVAAGLEKAVRFAWQRWCQNLPAQAFEVTHQAEQMDIVIQ